MGFFGPSQEDLKAVNKGLRAENEQLVKQNKAIKKDLTQFREDQAEYESKAVKRSSKYYADQDENNRIYRKELSTEQEDAIETAERTADKRVRAAEDAATIRVRAAEDKAAEAIREAKLNTQKVEIAVASAVLDEQKRHSGVTTKLEVAVAEQTARAESAEEMVVSLQDSLEAMTDLFKEFAGTNQEFANKLIGQLPKVDLTKMSINVEMPAPEVTVIAGGSKGGDQTKK